MLQMQNVSVNSLRKNGSLCINTVDGAGRTVAVTRFSVLRIGVDSREVIEIRTETPNGKSEHKVEVYAL